MKKIYLILIITLGFFQISSAQVDFGIKGGINYNSDSFQNVKDDIIKENGDGRTGYHAGIWLKVELPLDFYFRPEIVYTDLGTEITYLAANSQTLNSSTAVTTDFDFQKIDVPVLFGKNLFNLVNVFVGPSFQYIIDSDFSFDNLEKDEIDNFTVGIQLGTGVEFGPIGIDVRWERGFNDTETRFLDKSTNTNVEFDTRVNQIIVGLSLKF